MISDDESQAISAYQYHPDAFLKSGFRAADFRAAMERCFPAWREAMRWLTLSDRRELPMGGIQYIEASGHESAAHCSNAVFTLSAPMGKLLEQLPNPPFFRCQRSFIVHLSAVRMAPDGNLIAGRERRVIPVSRKLADAVRDAWERWNAWEARQPPEVKI